MRHRVPGMPLLVIVLALVSTLDAADKPQDKPQTEKTNPKATATKNNNPNPIRVTQHPFQMPPSETYVIGPEDILAINVWREPEISRVLPVRPDGNISLPLIGELKAAGLTPTELQNKIIEQLRAYLSNPEVAVIVQEVRSQKFNVVGDVLRPGSYDLSKPMTVLDALALAGGFGPWAKVNKIYVLRRSRDGTRMIIPFKYKDVIKGKKGYQDLELEPGDTVVVP